MNLVPTTRRLLAAGLFATAFAAAPAYGQVRVQGGSAHDASQQVGSGGVNSAISTPDYRVRNLLVTGQVGGGRAFRGDINYFAPGEFQGSLGSDTLYNFSRDSVFSAPGGVNLAARDIGGTVVVTRPTTSIPGMRVNTGNSLYNNGSYDPGTGTLSFRQSGGGLVAVTGIRDISQAAQSVSRLGLIRTSDGRLVGDDNRGNQLYNPLDPSNALDPNINPSTQPGGEPEEDKKPSLLDPATKPGETTDPTTDPSQPLNTQAQDLNVKSYPLAVTLGTQVNSVLARKLAGLDNPSLTVDQARQLREQMFGSAATTASKEDPAAPTNPYDKVIADILAAKNAAKQGIDDPNKDNPQTPTQRWQDILEAPEKSAIQAKQRAREAATRIALGLVDDKGNADFSKPLPKIDADSELAKLLNDLDYKLPPVKSLAGENKSRINTMMSTAEDLLSKGEYIKAETLYSQVMIETRGDAMAKAGMIHSQLAGGKIRSAAHNLRAQFTTSPQLIALRYDAKLLPSTDRLKWLQGQLQKMINDNHRYTADCGLVLAYLGHQLDAQPLVEYGLSVAQAKAPRDPLMPVLRSVWIKKADDKSDKKPDKKSDTPAKKDPAPKAEDASK